MSNHFETLKEFDDFIAGAVEDFAGEDMDPSDYCFEVADGSAVQHLLLARVGFGGGHAPQRRRLDSAELDYADVFPMADDANLDTRMTRLAYLLTHAAPRMASANQLPHPSKGGGVFRCQYRQTT